MPRVYNFAAGPGTLPLPVLEEVAANFVDYHGEGMSLIEMSHRGAIFTDIIEETRLLVRELLDVPETHDILFLQGADTCNLPWFRSICLGRPQRQATS